MVENVQTGGVMQFDYGKGDRQQASERIKREIREAYEKAELRKADEKRREMIWWIVGLILFILIVCFLIYFSR